MDKNKLIPIAILLASIILGGFYYASEINKQQSIEKREQTESKIMNEQENIKNNSLTESAISVEKTNNEELKSEIDNILHALLVLHYVSIIDKKSVDPNSVILDELQESMNDLNKLQGLKYETESISKSKNEIIATTGLAINVTALTLIETYSTWIEYLRSVDINTVNISEFQYQLALFQTSTHDSYLTLVKGVSLLPMVTVEFAKEEDAENSVNEDLKNHFLKKIDELFTDILTDNEIFYKETKNRYVVPVIIQGYKDFFINKL